MANKKGTSKVPTTQTGMRETRASVSQWAKTTRRHSPESSVKKPNSKRPLRRSPLRLKPRRMPVGRLRPLSHPSWKKPSSPRSQRPTRLIYKTLTYFQESCEKTYLEEIDRKDMLKFAAFLRDEKELEPRTCWNKFNVTLLFLKAQGVRGIVGKNDWRKFVEEEPEIYEKENLEALFAACTPAEKLLFQFYQQTGMREQEVIYTTWPDVNLTRHTVTVRWKPEYKWSPKNSKEREMPIPKQLADDLKAARANAPKDCPLVFHTSECLPKFDALHVLKAVARRAELDEDNFLHKFRSTFATWALQAGVDVRTVQQWLGHSDVESTLRYLKPCAISGASITSRPRPARRLKVCARIAIACCGPRS
jgi:integrase